MPRWNKCAEGTPGRRHRFQEANTRGSCAQRRVSLAAPTDSGWTTSWRTTCAKKSFAIRGLLAGVTTVLGPEDKVRRAVERADRSRPRTGSADRVRQCEHVGKGGSDKGFPVLWSRRRRSPIRRFARSDPRSGGNCSLTAGFADARSAVTRAQEGHDCHRPGFEPLKRARDVTHHCRLSPVRPADVRSCRHFRRVSTFDICEPCEYWGLIVSKGKPATFKRRCRHSQRTSAKCWHRRCPIGVYDCSILVSRFLSRLMTALIGLLLQRSESARRTSPVLRP